MEDEFDRIMEFFNLSPEEGESKLSEVLEDVFEYFERFKHVMLNGTPEEKQKAVDRVMKLKKKIEEVTQNVCEKTGMDPDQLTAYSSNPKHFSESQWHMLEEAKKRFKSGMQEMQNAFVTRDKNASSKEGDKDAKHRKRKHGHPKNWMPS